MEIKKKPQEIFTEYEEGKSFNQNHDLYDNVKKNQRFFLGNQWEGVNAPDLTKPVFNILKRVVSYFIAMIVSDDVGVYITPFDETPENKVQADIMAQEVEAVLERTRTNTKARTNVKNACVDGDTCLFINFDPDIETNQTYKGDIETEIIDNTHVIFGNPYSNVVDKQPYILIVQRLYTKQVKDMAKALGVSQADINKIVPDEDDFVETTDSSFDKQLTTVITKFWKETTNVKKTDKFNNEYTDKETTVHMMKVTSQVVLKDDTDLKYHRYPLAYWTWEKVKNCYHGQSPITGLIPNQIFINKIYAMCMVYMTNMGFPRVFYDENKIAKITNDVSKATAVTNMDLAGRIMDAVKAPDFSNQIIQLVDSTINYTKDFMGASDAALGNISNPNNTSAIVAVQQASSVPLEIQKLDYYAFYEDIVRSIVDIMGVSYGERYVKITESQAKDLGRFTIDPITGEERYETFIKIDFSQLHNMNYEVNVEIGQSSYWSEQTQVQTMDNLFDKGIITNPITYLEGIPDKYIPNKQKIMEEIKQQQEQILAQQRLEQEAQQQPQGTWDPNLTAGMQDGEDNRAPVQFAGNEQLQDVYAQSKEFYGG